MSKLHHPRISIVTVNYRNPAITIELLHSLYRCPFQDFEIIVVENSPFNDPTELYREAFPDVKVIISEKNLGFAGGNNLGIKATIGEFVYFINNDTEVVTETFTPLLKVMDQDKLIGAICPKIKYHQDPKRIQFAGFTEVNALGRNKMMGKNEIDQGQYDQGINIPYGHGAAMMVRKKVIDEVGLMPEHYFLYYEELDWSIQIVRSGYYIRYEPRGVIYHKESMTVGKMSPLKTFYINRNRILFMRKNMHGWKACIFYLYYLCIAFPKNLITHTLKREWEHVRSLLRATAQGFGRIHLVK